MVSEVSKHRGLLLPYCQGMGLDVASGGDPGVPWAISLDLPPAEAERYTTTDFGVQPIHLRGTCRDLYWFRDGVLDFVLSSHVIEDFRRDEQPALLAEWGRVVRPGGFLVLLYPEQTLWAAAVGCGRQVMNHNHQYEPHGGEVAEMLRTLGGWEIVADCLCAEGDFNWLTVGRKT